MNRATSAERVLLYRCLRPRSRTNTSVLLLLCSSRLESCPRVRPKDHRCREKQVEGLPPRGRGVTGSVRRSGPGELSVSSYKSGRDPSLLVSESRVEGFTVETPSGTPGTDLVSGRGGTGLWTVGGKEGREGHLGIQEVSECVLGNRPNARTPSRFLVSVGEWGPVPL